jgi:hypothetical protein
MKFTKADRMCYSKRRFPTEIKAACAIGNMKAKYSDASQVIWQWYQCPVCLGFHITKKSQNSKEYQKRRFMSGGSMTGLVSG